MRRTGSAAPGFRIRGSASYASAVYSGVFCLLALRNARDWRRGEDIRLQELQDHHIFPQAYLKRHEITKRVDVNTIANRTLISDETNGKIKDKAPLHTSETRAFCRPAPAATFSGRTSSTTRRFPCCSPPSRSCPTPRPPTFTAGFFKLVKPR